MLLPLYLRREPTDDRYRPPGKLDVVLYRDEACTDRAGRWPWFDNSRPTRRNRSIMFNCWRWRIVWMPDLSSQTAKG